MSRPYPQFGDFQWECFSIKIIYFDTVTRIAVTDHLPDAGLCSSYLLNADPVGNKKKLTSEESVADVECADMALISDSYESLYTLHSTYYDRGTPLATRDETFSCVTGIKRLPIVHLPLFSVINVISLIWYHASFQFLGSTVSNNCTLKVKMLARITNHSVIQSHSTAFLDTRELSILSPS